MLKIAILVISIADPGQISFGVSNASFEDSATCEAAKPRHIADAQQRYANIVGGVVVRAICTSAQKADEMMKDKDLNGSWI